jgi:hypothetical protein
MKVTFGAASWWGLIGAIIAGLSPLFTSISAEQGGIIAAVLSVVTIIGRQLQAMSMTSHPFPFDELGVVDEPEVIPTDVSAAAVADGTV